MKKLTKAVSLGLCAVLAAGMPACPATASAGAASTGGTSTAGTSTGASASGDIVNLKWVTVGTGMPGNYDSWAAKVNEYWARKSVSTSKWKWCPGAIGMHAAALS